jgi:TDG/mug DNA glycosylase family protein
MTPSSPHRPTSAQLAAAFGRRIPNLIAPDLAVLFCGINPGLYSGATGHHFARPGNRFWPALHRSGFTPRLLHPWQEQELLALGIGITNMVARTTATAAELSDEEFRAGRQRLRRNVLKYSPRWLAVLGLGAYRAAFAEPTAQIGPQQRTIGSTRVWVLPNPSGLNAHHQLPELTAMFAALRVAAFDVQRHSG